MTLEAGLRVVTAFCQEDPRNGQRVLEAETINHRPILSELLSYTRDKRPLVRLHAATCLTHLFRSKLFSALPDPIHFHLMPCLIKLFDAPYPINEQACLVFASLVQDSEDMQQLASDMDTIPKLADLVRPSSSSTPPPFSSSSHPKSVFLKPSPTSTSTSTSTSSTSTSSSSTSSLSSKETSLSEAVLLAMAGVSSLHEPSRKLFCQHPWLTSWTVQNLTHPSLHVRAAACQCLRSISRSVKHLRSTLLDAGLVDPLFQLFHEETHPTVLIPASAVLCNLVLDFAPMKHLFIEKGGIERLAQWTVTSTDLQLRMNSVWAFKNLAYNAVLSTKQKLMETLGFQPLKNLLNDPDVGLQEQAFNLLRNLVCGAEEDVDYICQGLGSNELMELMAMTFIKPRKDPSHPTPTPTQIQEKEKEKEKELNEHFHPTTTNTNTTTSDILHQALCVIVNVAAGGEKHKQMIMQHDGLLKSIFGFMKDPHASIRVASVWIVINLTWPEDPHSTNRIVQLRELGFEHVLQHLKKDSDVDVRDRVKAALLQFNDAT
ncbi:Armadillo repeat-containing protein 8 [Coelomomyces lativittatus]|nr:Armadillo repeat-containing protein 8 [Coelomomyces lativittatus]